MSASQHTYQPHNEDQFPNNPHFHPFKQEPVVTSVKKLLKRKYNLGSPKHVSKAVFPFLKLFQSKYTFTDAWVDAIAGVTLSTILIPQSLSYAVLAGLTAQYGLYSAFFAPLIYFIFGTTRELSVGPFALVSIIIAEMINNMFPELIELAKVQPAEAMALRLGYTMTLSFISGVWLILMAVFKLGWIIDLVSTPAVNGLIMATALSVSASQLGALFGVETSQGSALACVISLFKNIAKTNWLSLVIGTTGIILLILADLWTVKKKLKIPPPIQICLVLAITAISALFNFHDKFNLAVVGEIPRGFLPSVLPKFSLLFSNVSFAINGFLVAVVCFVISSSVSVQMGEENKYKVNFNSELFSLGLASLMGSFLNSYTSSASLSRTSVVNACKPRTNLWNLWSSAILLLVILLLGPLLFHLPKTILSSVVIGAFRGQFMKYDQGWIIFKKAPVEGIVYFLTLLATLLVSVQAGLIAAFASSLLSIILQQTSFNPTFLLQVPATQRFETWNRFSLGPYYSYLEEVESQGGLQKRKQPKHTRSIQAIDSDLFGGNDNGDVGSGSGSHGYEQQFDHDDDNTSANTDHSQGDHMTNFNLYNLNSTPNQITGSSGSYNNTPTNQTISHAGDLTDLRPSPEHSLEMSNPVQLQALMEVQNPNVAILHIGQQITFLNANPISEYIHRYIEMHREYHKRSRLLPQQNGQMSQFSPVQISPNSAQPLNANQLQSDSLSIPPHGQQQGINIEEYLSIAPTALRETLGKQTTQNDNLVLSTQKSQSQINSAYPDRFLTNNNIFGSSDTTSTSRRQQNASTSLLNSQGSQQSVVVSTDDEDQDNFDGDLVNQPNTYINPIKTKSQTGALPPPSDSTASAYPLLSIHQSRLFTSLIRDTLEAYSDQQIIKFEFCLVLDCVQSADLTGEAMLNKLRNQFPFVLFLFTRPSMTFLYGYVQKNGKGNGKNGVLNAVLPSGFVLNDLFVATNYAKYTIDMATAGRYIENKSAAGNDQ